MREREWTEDLHLTEEEIWDVASHEASDEVRQWWEIHRQSCAACVEAVRIAEAVAAREAEMALTPLTPVERQRVLDRITETIREERGVARGAGRRREGDTSGEA